MYYYYVTRFTRSEVVILLIVLRIRNARKYLKIFQCSLVQSALLYIHFFLCELLKF